MTITNADIVGRLKLLADEHLKADSGTTTAVVNSSLIDGADVSNKYVCFVSGSNIGVDRIATDFATESGTITIATLDNAVTNTDEFCIVSKGFQSDVVQAESVIRNDLRNRGYDLDLFLTEPQLKEMYIYKAIELICASLMNDGDDQDVYFVHYNRFKKLYEIETNTMIADYDKNEDGTIGDDEELQSPRQSFFVR